MPAEAGARYAPPFWRRKRDFRAVKRTGAATTEHKTAPHSGGSSDAAKLRRGTTPHQPGASTLPEAALGGKSIRVGPAVSAASLLHGSRIHTAPALCVERPASRPKRAGSREVPRPMMAGVEAAVSDRGIPAAGSKAKPASYRYPPTKQTKEKAVPACGCRTNSKDVHDVSEYPTAYRACVS